MPKNPFFRLILTGAIVASAAFAAPRVFTPEVRFNSALEISGVRGSPASRKPLMATSVQVARAKTDVGPFRNRIDTGRPLPDEAGDVPLRNDLRDHHFRVAALEPERV